MPNNYAAIIQKNIQDLFALDLDERAQALPARRRNQDLEFQAFGNPCTLSTEGVRLKDDPQTGPMGIVISLYALQATTEACVLEPYQSFKELPHSTPYVGAFANRTEHYLASFVERLAPARPRILTALDGSDAPPQVSGDLSFVVKPLPKIALCYVCYAADEDFPAAVTCLYSQNAQRFLTTDALADLGEYTSKAIKALV